MCDEPLVATDAGAEHIVQLRADALCHRCGDIVLRALGPAQVDVTIDSDEPVPSNLMALVSRYTRTTNASAT